VDRLHKASADGVPGQPGRPVAMARARGRAALEALEAAILAAGEGTDVAGHAAAAGLGYAARTADDLAMEALALQTRFD